MAKAKRSKKAQVKLRASTPSTRPVTPPLPNEIWRYILAHVSEEDKATLAACMRVSLVLNQLAAPLLYRSIAISDDTVHHDLHPLAIPKIPAGPQRLSATKSENLHLIEHVELRTHDSKTCLQAIGKMQTGRASRSASLAVSTLYVELCHYDRLHEYRRRGRGGVSSDARCAVLSRLRPRTLVLRDVWTFSLLLDNPILLSGTETVVCVFYVDPSRHPANPIRRADPIDSAVAIIKDDTSPSYHGRHWSKRPSGIRGAVTRLMTSIPAKSYTIVNAPPAMFDPSPNPPCTFISKEEYIANHDWKVVFSQQEVDEWLRIPFEAS